MVKNILGMISGGYDFARITNAYPELTEEDLRDTLDYAPLWLTTRKRETMGGFYG